jgi:ABC-type methionine transport system ATPase subunit
MMGGSIAKADSIDDIVNQSRKDVASGISDSNQKFKNSMAEINKQSKIDSAKLDVIEKRVKQELLPLIPKGYEAGIANIARRINGITANGMANGRADYDKQQEAIDKVKQVMQKYSDSGMKQYDEVEKMLKSQYYKW